MIYNGKGGAGRLKKYIVVTKKETNSFATENIDMINDVCWIDDHKRQAGEEL